MEAPPCGDAVYAAGRFISSVHYAIMELPELLYFSLPAPDSAFLLTAVIKTPLLTQSTVEKKNKEKKPNTQCLILCLFFLLLPLITWLF